MLNWFKKYQTSKLYYPLILGLLISIYLIINGAYCFLKLNNNHYNALDLGIYTNVFYNTAHGANFISSIHPPSYLGDHLELLIWPLAKFYQLLPTPLTLLWLQTLFLALAAWPIYLIAKKILNQNWALFFAAWWLLNPFVQNINLFEFHLLAFAPFFLFWVYYFWQKSSWLNFFIFSAISLLIREDVALVIAMFGLLSLTNKKYFLADYKFSWSKFLVWVITPIILGGVWFVVANQLIAGFNADQHYKFFYYYQWLGNNWSELLLNLIVKPQLVWPTLLSFNNIFIVLGLLAPWLFLPILAPVTLILTLPIFLQYLLSVTNPIILTLHYPALLLPGLLIASSFGLAKLLKKPPIWLSFLAKEKSLIVISLTATTLYTCLIAGPITGLTTELKTKPEVLAGEILKSIKSDQTLMVSDTWLTSTANRSNIFLLRYWFWGQQQFSSKSYSFPETTQQILINSDDLINYSLIKRPWVMLTGAKDSAIRLRQLLEKYHFGCQLYYGHYLLLQKDLVNNCLYEQTTQAPKNLSYKKFNLPLELLGYETAKTLNFGGVKFLPLNLFWQKTSTIDLDLFLKTTWLNQVGEILKTDYYPLALGFYPPSDWPTNQTVITKYNLSQPSTNQKIYLKLELVYLTGHLTTASNRASLRELGQEKSLGSKIIMMP
ncbi:MAG: DUF2079 domain-containing protein [Candidatus Buchananbacteria bacterium]